MSEPDIPGDAPDTRIDAAYRQAEALLNDDAARSARRERVLAAVEREPVAAASAPPGARRSARRRGGPRLDALAGGVAGVTGLTLLTAPQLYQLTPSLHPAAKVVIPPASPASTPAPRAKAVAPQPVVKLGAPSAAALPIPAKPKAPALPC